jgi:RNA polymerase subunit RPABC4/transcription elongation factor Spt4
MLKWHDLKINSSGVIEYDITFKTRTKRTIVQKPDTTALMELWRRESGHTYKDDAFIFPDDHGRQYKTLMQSIRLMARLEKYAGLHNLKPSSIRNTAITHDVMAGLPLTYICMRAWGEPYNDMINIYVKANSAQMQTDQHAKSGQPTLKIIEKPVRVLKACPSCGKQDVMASDFCPFCGSNMSERTPGIITDLQDQLKELTRKLDLLTKTAHPL